MDFRKFINKAQDDKDRFLKEPGDQIVSKETLNEEDYDSSPEPARKNSDDDYYNTVNPDTGMKFDIPLLSPLDPDYYFQYVYYMKLREESPEAFEKVLNWD